MTIGKRGDHTNTGIEDKIAAILLARGAHAMEMEELKSAAAVNKKAYWCALGRMRQKGKVFSWRTEIFMEYFCLPQFRGEAYYHEPRRLVNSPFTPPVEVIVKRSPPFVSLEHWDEEDGRAVERTAIRSNRYSDQLL